MIASFPSVDINSTVGVSECAVCVCIGRKALELYGSPVPFRFSEVVFLFQPLARCRELPLDYRALKRVLCSRLDHCSDRNVMLEFLVVSSCANFRGMRIGRLTSVIHVTCILGLNAPVERLSCVAHTGYRGAMIVLCMGDAMKYFLPT
jgi:hypothetical protein